MMSDVGLLRVRKIYSGKRLNESWVEHKVASRLFPERHFTYLPFLKHK